MPPVQVYVEAPLPVNVTAFPEQITVLVGVIVSVGLGFTFTVIVAIPEQDPGLVAVTV